MGHIRWSLEERAYSFCSHLSAATQCSPITTTMTVTTAMRPPVLVKMTLVAAPGFAGGPGNLGQWLDEVFGLEWAKLGQIDDRRAK